MGSTTTTSRGYGLPMSALMAARGSLVRRCHGHADSRCPNPAPNRSEYCDDCIDDIAFGDPVSSAPPFPFNVTCSKHGIEFVRVGRYTDDGELECGQCLAAAARPFQERRIEAALAGI